MCVWEGSWIFCKQRWGNYRLMRHFYSLFFYAPRLDGLKKEAEEDNQRKIQAFNDVMLKKEKERMDRG